MAKHSLRLVIITGDHHLPDAAKPGEIYGAEDLQTHRKMEEAFESLPGFEISIWNNHEHLFEHLQEVRPDLVVNFCDTGYRNVAADELTIPVFLETLGIAYTGAPAAAIVLCYDKQIVRLAAEALGVAVPHEAYLGAEDAPPEFFPALIKPNRADGSLGITKDAVVRNKNEARKYLDWLRTALPDVDALYQEYLPGPEYGIGLIGNPESALRALPTLEVDFSGLPAGLNPILSYESKSIPDSPYWTDIRFKRADLSGEVEAQMIESCKKLFRRFGLRDYGRFDFRCDANGIPKLMEINPNPAWGWDAKLAIMAGFEDITYPDMLQMIIKAALGRIGR